MPVWSGAAAIAVMGIWVLTAAGFAPRGNGLVAALVPPWGPGGMAAAAGTGLAVVDLRWGGHVLILDTGGDPGALTRLRAMGFWLVDASGLVGCSDEEAA